MSMIYSMNDAHTPLHVLICSIAIGRMPAGSQRDTALAEFYEKWQFEPLVVLKWLALQV